MGKRNSSNTQAHFDFAKTDVEGRLNANVGMNVSSEGGLSIFEFPEPMSEHEADLQKKVRDQLVRLFATEGRNFDLEGVLALSDKVDSILSDVGYESGHDSGSKRINVRRSPNDRSGEYR